MTLVMKFSSFKYHDFHGFMQIFHRILIILIIYYIKTTEI